MVTKFDRATRKGSHRSGESDSSGNRERAAHDSLARENQNSDRYTPKDYPGDSYYTLQQIYREYVKSGKLRRRAKGNRLHPN